MTNRISSTDKNCRYLKEDHFVAGAFLNLLKELRITLPRGVTLLEAIRWGWLSPSLRVRLPATFYLDWENFPLRPRIGKLRPEDEWAAHVYHASEAFHPRHDRHHTDDDWFVHPFDRGGEHSFIPHDAVVPVELPDPPAVHHANGETITPLIDFFAYWQAYRLVDSLRAAVLAGSLIDTPSAEEVLKQIIDSLPERRELCAAGLNAIARRYEARAMTFDWLSRYRTLVGAAVASHAGRDERRNAAQRLARQLAFDPDGAKGQIRDILLTFFQELKWSHRNSDDAPPVMTLLRQDIRLALDFIADATGSPVQLDDPAWNSNSRSELIWARMYEALPYELERSRMRFPMIATIYTKNYSIEERLGLAEREIEALVTRWWPECYPLRRFILLFQRLHDTLGGDEARIAFNERNTIDYLILCTLVAEKLMVWMWLREQRQPAEVPGFRKLVEESTDRIASKLSLDPIRTSLAKYYPDTKLNDLTVSRKLQLFDSCPGLSDRKSELVLQCLLNFIIMQNYAAHHDCLDWELAYSEIGNQAVTSVVTVLLVLLK